MASSTASSSTSSITPVLPLNLKSKKQRKTLNQSYSRPPPLNLALSNLDPDETSSLTPSSERKSSSSLSESPSENIELSASPLGDLFKEQAESVRRAWNAASCFAEFDSSDPSFGPQPHEVYSNNAKQPRMGQRRVFSGSFPKKSLSRIVSASDLSEPAILSPPATPLTPLTPVFDSVPRHREKDANSCRSSLKKSKDLSRSPPTESQSPLTPEVTQDDDDCTRLTCNKRVHFAPGSPLRGSTWSLNQYPSRSITANPMENLSLTEWLELVTRRRSIRNRRAEMMGLPL
ncbi:hypothetical protein O181_072305 [Austropuccinia psidii MF-1]|uniref:Uncharacterized protein n=1 Tax=Austropuccinia psidii MF-1 TaxID=1389203 RepID=A0A9Q3F0B1_9BASI|nr:hypothetical protein [Austropuccinia psidii MF-1]